MYLTSLKVGRYFNENQLSNHSVCSCFLYHTTNVTFGLGLPKNKTKLWLDCSVVYILVNDVLMYISLLMQILINYEEKKLENIEMKKFG